MLTRLFENKFARNVLLVATGTAGAQAITMTFAPFITRLYGPEAFGLLGTFQAILAVITPIAALTYPIAIVLPKSDNDARGIAKLSVRLAAILAIGFTMILLVGKKQIAELLNIQVIAGFLWLIPIAMFFSALQQVMQQWLIRKSQFKVTARVAVSQSFILNSAKIGVGWFYPVGVVLILLATLGSALHSIQLWFASQRWAKPGEHIKFNNNKDVELKPLAHKYRDFPYYRAPQAFLNAVSQSFPTLLLIAVFNPAVAGFFTLSKTVLAAPASLIGSSVGNVFYPRITEIVNEGKNPIRLLVKATIGIFLIVCIPFSIVLMFGPWLFKLIFGAEWGDAGVFAQWMTVWLVVSVAARPTIAIIPVMKMQRFFLLYEVCFTIIKVGALVVGGVYFESSVAAVAAYSLVSAMFYVLLFLIVLLALLRRKFCM